MPAIFDDPHVIAAHGMLDPKLRLKHQPYAKLIGLEEPKNKWYRKLDKSRPVAVGHHSYHKIPHIPTIRNKQFYGLDTRCAEGGNLTALILPTKEIVQVPARKNYWLETKAKALKLLESGHYMSKPTLPYAEPKNQRMSLNKTGQIKRKELPALQ
jgi:hypothetical protein